MNTHNPAPERLLEIIRTQTEIAKLGLDLQGVMELVAHRTLDVTGAEGAVVELAEGPHMVYRAVAGLASDMLGVRLDREQSLSGLCVASASPLRCDDSENDQRVDRETCRRVGLRSMIVVPLIHAGQAVGALKVFSRTPGFFGEDDLQTLALMSDLIAAAMFHATSLGTDELFKRATTDSLTGLANRAHFLDLLRRGMIRAERENQTLGVLMVDMDRLKLINDQHGHRAGDAAIKETANRIAKRIRQSDTAARLGGDEFAVLLPRVDSPAGAALLAERMVQTCDQPLEFEGRLLPLGVSIGVAVFPEDGRQVESLLENADRAMYGVKRERRTREL